MGKKLIPPTVDFCGKEIFENEVVRKYFLSAVLKIPVDEIKSTKMLNPFLELSLPNEKQGILDILIELQDERRINIEIQVERQDYWDRRSVFYLAKLYSKKLRRGNDYTRLKSCINISILDFNYLETDGYHTTFRLRDENGNDYTDALEIHIIELKKLNEEKKKYIEEHEKLDDYDRAVQEWIQFFNCKWEEDATMLESKTKNPGIREAIKELMSVSFNGRLFTRYEQKMIRQGDAKAREAWVRKEGVKEGVKQGVKQGVDQEMQRNIEFLIKDSREQNVPEDILLARLQGRYGLSVEDARKQMDKIS